MTEIKNMLEFEPRYWADATLHWMLPKKNKERKVCQNILIEKIYPPDDMSIDEETLKASREQYEITHELIPVYLSFDYKLIGGFEQYVLAKELEKKWIPFIRKTKMNKSEKANFLKATHNRKIGNKRCPVKDINGNRIFVTKAQYKQLQEVQKIARKLKYSVKVLPDFRFKVMSGNDYIIGTPEKGVQLANVLAQIKKIENDRKQGRIE